MKLSTEEQIIVRSFKNLIKKLKKNELCDYSRISFVDKRKYPIIKHYSFYISDINTVESLGTLLHLNIDLIINCTECNLNKFEDLIAILFICILFNYFLDIRAHLRYRKQCPIVF